MLHSFDVPPLCIASNSDGSRIAVGCVDGSVKFLNTENDSFETIWEFKTKSCVRSIDIDETNEKVYAVIKNRALCAFDINTGRRTRCILKAHSAAPMVVCSLPPSSLKNQQVATADEKGEVKTWDLRAECPVVRKWKEQEEEINELKIDSKHNLLSASSDGTLAAFDLRKGKLKVRSELMHSELLSICPTDKFTYVGGGDGFIEVFNHNEYGNLLERIESGFELGTNGIVELRRGLLLTSSSGSNKLRLLNVMPNKRLGIMGTHGDEHENDGIDIMTLSGDKTTLFTAISFNCTIKKWELTPIVEKIPILRSTDAKKKKNVGVGFFDDLIPEGQKNDEPKKKRRKEDDSDEESDDEGEDEQEDEDELEDEDEEEEADDEDEE
ncbi:unnamed protein product [Caenorhabditis bovis]|uniref:WD repeat-containing protein 55 homolog n=1 Tax=Caenorhabditis bovis TaxID=2654633 RepID=A0A8S1EU23_9PELO|nr:unnamed protein product [Caenorhabditis bovis]